MISSHPAISELAPINYNSMSRLKATFVSHFLVISFLQLYLAVEALPNHDPSPHDPSPNILSL